MTISKIVYIWLALLFLDIFTIQDISNLIENFGERYIINYSLTSLALLLILILIRNWNRWAIFILLIIPTLVQSTYFEVYEKLVSPFGFKIFLENIGMVLDLWIENIDIPKSLFLIFAIWWLVSKLPKGDISRYITIPSIILVIAIYGLIVFSWFSVPNLQNSIVSFYGAILDTFKQGIYQNFKLQRPDLENLQSSKRELPNILYIVGESAVLSHTSLFGYERDTTPKLRELERNGTIIKFTNVVSIGTKTRLSVPYMLVGLQGIDPHGEIYKYPTILNYMKAIGYRTIFITAQDLSWGGLKNFLIDKDIDYFVNGTKYNPNARVHKGADDLVVVENEILPILEKNSSKPLFLVYQMDGSHYPYSQHSPKSFKKWKEKGDNSINAYDNTLLYFDEVVAKIVINFRKRYPNGWIFYSTDHGQNLGKRGGMFNDNFELDVIHNLFFVSPPRKYLERLRKNQNSPISQADIVATILDIVGVQPIKPLDGVSILGEIPKERLRVVSNYMPTLHNVPEAVLVFPDLELIYIDFDKMSVTFPKSQQTIHFSELNSSYRLLFEKRLTD